MFQPRCLNRLRAPSLLSTSCYTNTKPRQSVVHSASSASTLLTTGDVDDPDLCSLLSTGAVKKQITRIQRGLSAVGDESRGQGKPFQEKGHVPRLEETGKERCMCHWTVYFLPVTWLPVTSQGPALPVPMWKCRV